MKKLLFLLLFSLTSILVFGQEPMILPKSETFSLGTESAYVIDIKSLNYEEAKDAWVDFTKKQKAKARKNKTGEYFSDNMNIPGISTNTIDLYAVFENIDNGSRAKIWFDLGGAYFKDDKFPDRVAAQRAFLGNYIKELEAVRIDKEIVLLEKALKENAKKNKKKKKEYNKLSKSNEKLQKQLKENTAELDKIKDANEQFALEHRMMEDQVKTLKQRSKSMRN